MLVTTIITLVSPSKLTASIAYDPALLMPVFADVSINGDDYTVTRVNRHGLSLSLAVLPERLVERIFAFMEHRKGDPTLDQETCVYRYTEV